MVTGVETLFLKQSCATVCVCKLQLLEQNKLQLRVEQTNVRY